jgi:hypothetical protein
MSSNSFAVRSHEGNANQSEENCNTRQNNTIHYTFLQFETSTRSKHKSPSSFLATDDGELKEEKLYIFLYRWAFYIPRSTLAI